MCESFARTAPLPFRGGFNGHTQVNLYVYFIMPNRSNTSRRSAAAEAAPAPAPVATRTRGRGSARATTPDPREQAASAAAANPPEAGGASTGADQPPTGGHHSDSESEHHTGISARCDDQHVFFVHMGDSLQEKSCRTSPEHLKLNRHPICSGSPPLYSREFNGKKKKNSEIRVTVFDADSGPAGAGAPAHIPNTVTPIREHIHYHV